VLALGTLARGADLVHPYDCRGVTSRRITRMRTEGDNFLGDHGCVAVRELLELREADDRFALREHGYVRGPLGFGMGRG